MQMKSGLGRLWTGFVCAALLAPGTLFAGLLGEGISAYYSYDVPNTATTTVPGWSWDAASSSLVSGVIRNFPMNNNLGTPTSPHAGFGNVFSGGGSSCGLGQTGTHDGTWMFPTNTSGWAMSLWASRNDTATRSLLLVNQNGAYLTDATAKMAAQIIGTAPATTVNTGWGFWMASGGSYVFRCSLTTDGTTFTYKTLTSAKAYAQSSGTYHNFLVNLSGTTLSMYIDGELAATTTVAAGSYIKSTDAKYLATRYENSDGGQGQQNTLDDFAIWQRPLSVLEIAAIAANPINSIAGGDYAGIAYTAALSSDTNFADIVWTRTDDGTTATTPNLPTNAAATLTVADGTFNVTAPSAPPSIRALMLALADGASAASVAITWPNALPTGSATNQNSSFVSASYRSVASGITVTGTMADLPATGYLATFNAAKLALSVVKRPSLGIVSVKMGPRGPGNDLGWITPDLNAVGALPMSGAFWTNAYWSTQSNPNNGRYQDILRPIDAATGTNALTFVFSGRNPWYGSGAVDTPNGILTHCYLDDGTEDATMRYVVTNRADSSEVVTLPAAPNARGWQIELKNVPYAAYDVYFITASDVAAESLKEAPIKLSADGGATWISYQGDNTKMTTILGSSNWQGRPYSTGTLTEGLNYLKMRVTPAILQSASVAQLEITHGTPNSGNSVRSGLAGIQIVEVLSDGVYTRETAGSWFAAAWTTGGNAGQAWQDATAANPAYAVITGNVDSVTVDRDVSATLVTISGTHDFTLDGSGLLSSVQGVNAANLVGNFNLSAPVSGAIALGSGTVIGEPVADGVTNTMYGYTFTGSGTIKKTGAGTLVITNAFGNGIGFNIANGFVLLDAAAGVSLANGTSFTGFGTLAKTGAGAVTLTGTSALTGAFAVVAGTLRMGSQTCFGSTGTAAGPATIRVDSGATLDMNGQADYVNAFTLNGGALVNNGGAIGNNSRQIAAVSLTADSTLGGAANFGLIHSGFAIVPLDLAGHTLTKKGANTVAFCNVAATTGTLVIAEGAINCISSGSVFPGTVVVSNGASFVATAGAQIGVLTGNGTISGTGVIRVTNSVAATLGTIPVLTLDNDATIDCTAQNLTVSTTFTVAAASTVTVDATGRADLVAGTTLVSWPAMPAGAFTVKGLPDGLIAVKTTAGLVLIDSAKSDLVWTTGSGTWNATNFNNGTDNYMDGAKVAFADSTGNAAVAVTVDGSRSVAAFVASNAATAYTITGGAIAAPGLTKTGVGAFTVNAPLALAGPVSISGDPQVALTNVSGTVSGITIANHSTAAWGSTVIGLGANTFVNSGTTTIGNGQGFELRSSASRTYAGAISVGSGGALTLNPSAGTVTVSGAISGAGRIDKIGAGAVTLTGNATLTGTFRVYNGWATVNGALNAVTATKETPVFVQDGILRFEGNSNQGNRMPNSGWCVANNGEIQAYGVNLFNQYANPNFILTNSTFFADASMSGGHIKAASVELVNSDIKIATAVAAYVSQGFLPSTITVSGGTENAIYYATAPAAVTNTLVCANFVVAEGTVLSNSVVCSSATTKTGAGTLVAAGAWSRFIAGLTVNGGKLALPEYFGTISALTMAGGTTLDLTGRTTVPTLALTVADGSTVTVDVTGRALTVGAPLIYWSSMPAGSFQLKGLNRRAEKRSGGLYVGALYYYLRIQ